MKVCIAEKPSVAREIAQVLGATTKRDGYYEGNGYAVTYTFGHLCTLMEPSDYRPYWKSWDLNNLPMLPDKFKTKVVSNSGIQKQFKIVKSLFDKADLVINCGDAGTEGELIQRWVLDQANYKGKVQRLWISSLTTEAIKEGFNNLKDSKDYDNLYYAGYSRAIGDWLLGMNATRLYTVKHGGYKQVLSVGRVQTPTLAMVVSRFKEIENFKPQPYWELQTMYRDTLFTYEDGRFLKMEDGAILANKVKEDDFEIVSTTKKKGKEYAPKLFDLTGLQVYCNTKFGFSADDTLKIVQKLYEQKAVTYPRVDTTFLPNDVYPKVQGILAKLTNYAELTQPLLGKKTKKSAKVFNDKKVTDHHAIIPTGIQINLQYNQQQVYDIIVKRFIAVFYPDCDVSNTTVIGKAADVNFKTTGKEILKDGWKVVFKFGKSLSSNAFDKDTLPTFIAGEKGPHQPSFLEKQTKPPNQFTEASLLRAMETAGKHVDDDELRDLMKENGIGRPSTRANIIETLFKRQYIKRNKKQLIPTITGIALIDTIRSELLKSAELTGRWEKQLKDIEKGKYSASLFITNMKKMVDELVYEVRSETKRANISQATVVKQRQAKTKVTTGITSEICPKCKKGSILKGKSAYGCSHFKAGCHFVLPFENFGKKISEKQFIRLLQKGSTVNLKGFTSGTETTEGLLRFGDSFKLVLEAKKGKTKISEENKQVQKSDAINCPKCSKGNIIKGKTAYGCSHYKTGCDFKMTFDTIREKTKDRKLTKELVYSILKGGN
ncbi:DNA topoisomerase III [Psychroserpens burtonensis]|uniref:DNA topoisomerase n=1 Tax=Psychroserpens burtonensis TaxID=49278 RepID=A0A5C7BDW3_9FLAO|nr:type IA DNA topoisomerase [Psychroserpens burtonensis]TXE20228.1 DNA topoisomerase III [Psychroserpens burtonensis]